MRQLRLVIVDDHRLVLEAIRLALADAPDIEIVGEASNGTQVLPVVNQTRPDAILLDVNLPGIDGLRCLELLAQRHPDVKAVVLSGIDNTSVIESAFARGAVAFLRKDIDPRDLPSALRQAVAGTAFIGLAALPRTIGEDAARRAGLSERELSILRAVSAGLSNKAVAKQLSLAEQTVKFHLTNIYRKLDVTSRTEAIRCAYAQGLVGTAVLDAVVTAAA